MNKILKVVYWSVFLLLIVILLKQINILFDYELEKYEVQAKSKINNTIETNDIEFYQNQYNNKDIKGVLKTNEINTLIVQGSDNKYYLDHLINKEFNILGSVYIDYRVNLNDDKKIIIYGHSSKDYDTPFNNLHNYLEELTSKKNKIIELNILNKVNKYEVFSVKIVDNDEHLKLNFNDNLEWINHLKMLQENNLYENNIDTSEISEIVILQTCLLTEENKFLIVSGRKV